MLLSEIIPKMDQASSFSIRNEKAFEVLALTVSELDQPTCVFLDNSKYQADLKENITMVLTTPEIGKTLPMDTFGICITEQPRLLFFELHNYLSKNEKQYHRQTASTIIGEDCIISPLASIAEKNVRIGNNVIIEEFVSIKENTSIGDHSIIRAGTIIGGQGFEFKRQNDMTLPVNHLGGVIIGKNVEIQYNAAIDKAIYPWDNTEIGNYTRIDNLVHVGHAAKIDKNVMIVAHAGIGGRTIIKEGAWIGFGAIIRNGLVIGQNARTNMGSVVSQDVPDEGSVTGNFAIEHSKFIDELKKGKS